MKSQLTPPRRLSMFLSILAAIALFVLAAPLTACSSCRTKPSAEDCRAAINNIRKIRGTTQAQVGAAPKKAVRSCQGNSSRETVQCFIAAKSIEDLAKCEGEAGSKYFDQEQKAREERERKLKEKDAEKSDKKDEDKGD